MLVETRAKVGVFSIALGAYLPQFYPGRGTITFLGITQDGDGYFSSWSPRRERGWPDLHLWRHRHAHEVARMVPGKSEIAERPARS